jgi:predicted acyl esterase
LVPHAVRSNPGVATSAELDTCICSPGSISTICVVEIGTIGWIQISRAVPLGQSARRQPVAELVNMVVLQAMVPMRDGTRLNTFAFLRGERRTVLAGHPPSHALRHHGGRCPRRDRHF